jgi:hypothetical protein
MSGKCSRSPPPSSERDGFPFAVLACAVLRPMFGMLVLQALNNLSDEQVEYQVRDRVSFALFWGLAYVPDSLTQHLVAAERASAATSSACSRITLYNR